MKTLLVALLAAFALSACSSSSLSNAQSSCSDLPGYSEMWACIKDRVAKGTAGDMKNDLGLRYLAFGDAIDEKYRARAITNGEARLLLAQELSRGNAEYDARSAGQRAAFGEALSSMGQSMQQPRIVNCNTTYTPSGILGRPPVGSMTTCQ